MLIALEFPGSLENLFDGFVAIFQRHPGVGVPVRTTEPYGKIPWHEGSLKILAETVLCEEAHQTEAIDNSYDQASDCSQPGASQHQPQGRIQRGIAWAMVVIAVTERQQPAEQETAYGSYHSA
jgi:hypothetical protein